MTLISVILGILLLLPRLALNYEEHKLYRHHSVLKDERILLSGGYRDVLFDDKNLISLDIETWKYSVCTTLGTSHHFLWPLSRGTDVDTFFTLTPSLESTSLRSSNPVLYSWTWHDDVPIVTETVKWTDVRVPATGAFFEVPDHELGFYFHDISKADLATGLAQDGAALDDDARYYTLGNIFDFPSNTAYNVAPQDQVFVTQGMPSYVSNYGLSGALVSIGGTEAMVEPITRLDNASFDERERMLTATLDSVNIVDIGSLLTDATGREISTQWLQQLTTGDTPEPRFDFCTFSVTPPNNASQLIYLYGGRNKTFIFDDIYALTLPAFSWTRLHATNVSKAAHTCHFTNNSMIVIGGYSHPHDNRTSDHWGCLSVASFDLSKGRWSQNISIDMSGCTSKVAHIHRGQCLMGATSSIISQWTSVFPQPLVARYILPYLNVLTVALSILAMRLMLEKTIRHRDPFQESSIAFFWRVLYSPAQSYVDAQPISYLCSCNTLAFHYTHVADNRGQILPDLWNNHLQKNNHNSNYHKKPVGKAITRLTCACLYRFMQRKRLDEETGDGKDRDRNPDKDRPYGSAVATSNPRCADRTAPHILICASTNASVLPKLHQLCVACIGNDQSLFELLRQVQRPWLVRCIRPWSWFRTVVGINYVQFSLLHNDMTQILRRNTEKAYIQPPLDAEYQPCFDHIFSHPLSPAFMLEAYQRPSVAGTGTFYIQCMTKRIKGALEKPTLGTIAYGMELEEGFDKSKVGWAGVALLIICIIFGAVWAGIFHDVSAGYAISACLMAVVIFLCSAFMASSQRVEPVYAD